MKSSQALQLTRCKKRVVELEEHVYNTMSALDSVQPKLELLDKIVKKWHTADNHYSFGEDVGTLIDLSGLYDIHR